MSDVFISYKQEERERMRPIAEALRVLKVDAWFDARLQPDRPFTEEIRHEIDHCRAQLVCWSPAAMRSEWVRGEAEVGRQRGVLISVMIETTVLHPPFNMHHAENLVGWAGTWNHDGWLKVVDAIGRKLGRPGLRELALLQDSLEAERWRKWAERYPTDLAAEEAWAKTEALHIDSERARLAKQRDDARRRAEEREARTATVSQIPPAPPSATSKPVAERGWLTVPRLLMTFAALLVVGVGGIVATNVVESNRARVAQAALAADETEWERAVGVNTAEAYQQYLLNQPRGAHVAEARRTLAAFDAAGWEAVDVQAVPSIRRYLARFPQGAHAAEAQRLLDEFEESSLTTARRAGTSAALTAFLENWPDSAQRSVVVSERDRLRIREQALPPTVQQQPRQQAPRLTARNDPYEQCESWDALWRVDGETASLSSLQNWIGGVPSQCTNLRGVANARIALLQRATQGPAVACPTSDFVPYFEYDRSNLNQAAIETIDAAVNRARQCNIASVSIVGWATSAENISMGERRASVIRDALVARGVPSGVVRTQARQSSTNDPLDRRAAVTISFR